MKCSTPRVCAILALVVSWIVLVKLLLFLPIEDEKVLPMSKKRLSVVDDVIISINSREQLISQQKILDKMGSRNASDIIDPGKFTVYIQPKDINFQKEVLEPKTSFLILVTSVANSTARRKIVRSTWMKWANESNTKYLVRVYFFVGLAKSSPTWEIQKLIEENNIHNDMIVDDFTEHYFRLTPKTLRMLKWYTQTFPVSNSESSAAAPDFLIKTDHDVFIHIPNLASYLSSVLANASDSSVGSSPSTSGQIDEHVENHSFPPLSLNSKRGFSCDPVHPSRYFIGGNLYAIPYIETNPKSKFYIDPEFWFGKKLTSFPVYAGGPMYILSGNIVPVLYNGAFSVPLFHFEDAYLLGYVANDHFHFTLTKVEGVLSETGPTFYALQNKSKMRRIISLHPMEPPELMYTVYNLVTVNQTSTNWPNVTSAVE